MLKIVLLLASISQLSVGARILGIVPTPSFSHQIVFRSLWKELQNRGHEVLVLTADPENDSSSNVTEIDMHVTYKHTKYMVGSFRECSNFPARLGGFLMNFRTRIEETMFEIPEVQALLSNKTEHFDLIFAEIWYSVPFAFGYRFNAPVIGLVSLEMHNNFHAIYGNRVHPVAYPDIFMGKGEMELGILDRLHSTFFVTLYRFFSLLEFESRFKENQLLSRYFGPDVPSISQLDANLTMLFVNIAPMLNHRPLGLNTICIGGNTHLTDHKPLSKELAEYLDGAKTGAIYVSLGTNVKSDFIPNNVRQAFIGAFAELPYKILWKLDIELPNLPKNVKIVNWLPQQDVLRHPNIKAFVFQGGLQSLEEAIANKIPVVGIPFISDQDTNVRKLVKNGFGLGLDKDTITSQSLKEAILEIIKNSKYKAAITKMADIISDQPMTGLEKAVWWTEYVIRHKGAPHLRNPIMDIPFYQYYLLDVISFCLGVLAVSIFVSYKLIAAIKSIITKKLARKSKVN